MKARSRLFAFSLVEVVIALGVFSTGVIVVIALITSGASRSRESMDSKIALGLSERIRSEVISYFGQDLPTFSSDEPLRLVSSRVGDDVRIEAGDGRDAYFLVELMPLGSDELLRDANRGTVGADVTVHWPYRPPGTVNIDVEAAKNSVRYQLMFLR
jgi:hypothetical protein